MFVQSISKTKTRIAYHNPWTNSSENQAFASMAEAAARIGVELAACASHEDIEACNPDFVISLATAVPKVVDLPTYLVVHEPKSYLFEQPQRLRNILSYDGYLTISDRLERFIRDFSHGVGRPSEPGFFFNTPQTTDLRSDWRRPNRPATLRVAYFGTNWNRRTPLLFRALDRLELLRIHGPEGSWRKEGLKSYAGPVPFDGAGPQRIYAESGLGLALMDERWQQEDIVSNRIFEISSVGAVSISPDMPWARKWFGDSVLYFDAAQPVEAVAARIREHFEFCRENPERAREMGEEARRIFETRFSAERLISGACDYHLRAMAERDAARDALGLAPEVTVIVRCGGRPIEVLSRAVRSIARQTFGRFIVLFAKYRDLDLTALKSGEGGAIARFEEFCIEGGSRAEMLFAALGRVATPYFAVLDDDDFWLSDHMEQLFRAGRRERADFDFAFSGVVDFDYPIKFSETQSFDRNIGRFGFDKPLVDAQDVLDAIHLCGFVARADLVDPDTLAAPDMRTAEDSLLILMLVRRSRPIFSWKPTAFYRRDAADGSNWRADPARTEDEISLALRGGLAFAPSWLAAPSFALPDRIWANARKTIGASLMGEHLHRLIVGNRGWRVPAGITASGAEAGMMTHGPYVQLPPGRYRMTALVTPDAAAEADLLGEISVAAMPPGVTLAKAPITRSSSEIVLGFRVEPGMEDWRFEFPVSIRGRGGFTLASVTLYPAAADEPEFYPGPSESEGFPRAKETLRAALSRRLVAPIRDAGRRLRGVKR